MRAEMWTRVGLGEALRAFAAGFALFALAACADEGPRTELNWPVATYYTVVVRPGDRIDDIAARYSVSSGTVLRMNDLQAKSEIYPGEVLRIPPGNRATRTSVLRDAESSHVYAAPRTRDDPIRSAPLKPVRTARADPPVAKLPLAAPTTLQRVETALGVSSGQRFIWPVNGTVIESFGDMDGGERNDGINIAAPLDSPIRAAQAGTVSYAGNELRSYGNLILIKHDGGYITAYAHANRMAVAKGQHVEQGQIIGYAGTSGDVTRPQVHFEIRRDSHPVDPRALMAANS
jgi:murein DD-endopeptidase MepM/ murein hydrolase activator NlpD